MTRLVRTLVLATMMAAGCGGGDGGPAGVDGTKQISAASASDKAALCDWFAGKVGGYGTPSTCADGFIEAPPTKQECLDSFPSCAVTVSQFEDCIDTIVAAQNTCTPQSLAEAMANPNCQTVGAAGCFN
jgi:hypothetical protein